MGTRLQLLIAPILGIFIAVASVSAQRYTPPPPPLTTLPPCPLGKNGKPDKKQKNCDPTIYPSEKLEVKGKKAKEVVAPQNTPPASAEQFPYPGEQAPTRTDTPAAKAFPYPGSSESESGGKSPDGNAQQAPMQDSSGSISGHTDVAHDPGAEKRATDTPAGKAFPYPGDSAAGIPGDSDIHSAEGKPAGESSSSSSSSGGSVPEGDAGGASDAESAPGTKGEYDEDDTAPMPKAKDRKAQRAARPQSDDERVDEDLSVARFYGQSGNKMGAYLRAKDAVRTEPDYAEGHFVLGEAAERLGKKDEAAAEFSQYLKLAPDGERAKAAEKALANLR